MRKSKVLSDANRVQPIIRYDLGDSVTARPEPCACGKSASGDTSGGKARRRGLVTRTRRQYRPAFTIGIDDGIVEEAARAHFQIVQTAADRLMLRFDRSHEDDRQVVWRAAKDALRQYLTRQSLPNVHVGLDKQGPLIDRRSGKLREVVVAKK